MQFLRLIFVKKLQLQGALPPDPPLGAFCGPQAPTFQLTFPFLIPMPAMGLIHVNVVLNLKIQIYTSLIDRYQRETLFIVDMSINWVTDRNWQTRVFDPLKVTQLNFVREKRVKAVVMCILSSHARTSHCTLLFRCPVNKYSAKQFAVGEFELIPGEK